MAEDIGKIDRKFKILAVNPVNGKIYTDENSFLFCAKDAAVPLALQTYKRACIALGANDEHVASIELLISRVTQFQRENGARVPDTIGAELDRCLD